MSSSDLALSVRGLGKEYRIARNRGEAHSTLAESLLARARNPLRRAQHDTFWALKDVSFDVNKGDVVGVIGRNGAGKSTLLKVLSRITQPTTGEVKVWGRIGSLLEVGTGFHPELTGRENIFLNGAILGMTRAEIRREFDAIVDFAGVEKFLDTPVKRYSSGMYVRLAFAVAAHLQSEVLIVDEVLAVGDAEFQRKCLGKMRDVAAGGRTVLFVSHHMQSVLTLCTSAVYLCEGTLAYSGMVDPAIGRYASSYESVNELKLVPEDRRAGTGEVRVIEVRSDRAVYRSGECIGLTIPVARRGLPLGPFTVSAHLYDDRGTRITTCDTRLLGRSFDFGNRHNYDTSVFMRIRNPWLKPGNYRIDVSVVGDVLVDRCESACQFSIDDTLPYPGGDHPDAIGDALVFADFDASELPGVLSPSRAISAQ